jgi:peptidoglycan/xylan/chitin deacetylase (PgdA/CDA1 family)
MDIRRLPEGPFPDTARLAYRSMRSVYRKVRAGKNYFLNLLDSPIIILVYHRVTDLSSDPEMLAVSPENFRQHMEFLKQRYSIVRFEEDWPNLKEPAVVITFDDGYSDNVLEALPILEEVGVPATFFVSTWGIGTGKAFWWHELEDILLQDGEFPSHFKLDDARHGKAWDTSTLEGRKVLYNWLNAQMQRVAPGRRKSWLHQLAEWSGPGDVDMNMHRSMTRDEIKRLAASPWATIGAHTVTHSALSALAEEQQRNEIITSRQDLENITGMEITTFSYPFGRKRDYNQTSRRLCREAGFKKAAANFPGQVHRWTDPFQLPRHLVRNWDMDTFSGQIKSFWTR